jgi:asparagine synthase (glutamine-hydrolysing)
LVSSAAAAAGFRVALTGLGADELFGGYGTFGRVPAISAINSVLPASAAGAVLRRAGGNNAKVPELVKAGSRFCSTYEELRSVFTSAEVRRLTGQTWSLSCSEISQTRPMDAVSRLEVEHYMRNTLLRDADVYSMAQSLELRMPFVDHEILATALSFSNVRRAIFRKRLLARAIGSQRVREILGRRKQGFQLPMAEWLRGPLASRVEELPNGPVASSCDVGELRRQVAAWQANAGHHSKIWALVVLDAWLRRQAAPTSHSAGVAAPGPCHP